MWAGSDKGVLIGSGRKVKNGVNVLRVDNNMKRDEID